MANPSNRQEYSVSGSDEKAKSEGVGRDESTDAKDDGGKPDYTVGKVVELEGTHYLVASVTEGKDHQGNARKFAQLAPLSLVQVEVVED